MSSLVCLYWNYEIRKSRGVTYKSISKSISISIAGTYSLLNLCRWNDSACIRLSLCQIFLNINLLFPKFSFIDSFIVHMLRWKIYTILLLFFKNISLEFIYLTKQHRFWWSNGKQLSFVFLNLCLVLLKPLPCYF